MGTKYASEREEVCELTGEGSDGVSQPVVVLRLGRTLMHKVNYEYVGSESHCQIEKDLVLFAPENIEFFLITISRDSQERWKQPTKQNTRIYERAAPVLRQRRGTAQGEPLISQQTWRAGTAIAETPSPPQSA